MDSETPLSFLRPRAICPRSPFRAPSRSPRPRRELSSWLSKTQVLISLISKKKGRKEAPRPPYGAFLIAISERPNGSYVLLEPAVTGLPGVIFQRNQPIWHEMGMPRADKAAGGSLARLAHTPGALLDGPGPQGARWVRCTTVTHPNMSIGSPTHRNQMAQLKLGLSGGVGEPPGVWLSPKWAGPMGFQPHFRPACHFRFAHGSCSLRVK